MQVIAGLSPVPEGCRGAVIAIGNFDGVHRGHQALLTAAQAEARRLGVAWGVVSFEPHPRTWFKPEEPVFRLTPEALKARLVAALGASFIAVLPFDQALSDLSPEDFVSRHLVERLEAAHVVMGYDFHFGKGRKGSPQFLKDAGERLGFAVEVVEKIAFDARGSLDAVHSSGVRDALERGDVAYARQLLGRDYFVTGEIIHGAKLGRTIGFPTANLRLHDSSALAHGIYAVRIKVEGRTYDAVASWGRRPTVDNGPPLLEVYLFDFSGDLYGKTVEVAFVEWIRPELKFDGLEALTEQIEKDCGRAREILAGG